MDFVNEKYDEDCCDRWDRFIEKESMNGTFLQTRRFINYHPQGKFKDCSIVVYKGNQMVACILACEIRMGEKKTLYAHKGTSFGGLIIARNIYNASSISKLMDCIEEYFIQNGYEQVYLRMTPSVFSRENTDLLDYFLFQKGYQQYNELNYYLELDDYKDDILQKFSSSKRRDYRYSLKNPLQFRTLATKEEIKEFYGVLVSNLERLGLGCIHTLEELLDLKYNRFNDYIDFYGVYMDEKMIAGSMFFSFNDEIMHTQYLASDKQYLNCFPMDFLVYNLIETAIAKNMKKLTFGICTENEGRFINLGLSRFKEGFGSEYCINRTYFKLISGDDE